ncbi:MAG: hypothetical protein F6J89_26625 [Symploca sp. SIO1C4]|uniref:Uncharacterized protein n=1 Tax=Symploca sp. SIO1C4 TaxID=2607765 RepID=A0A6B3NH88_9CYAN|nr:hypothetical protein [Symploca sp. SIO1C4]
MGKFKIQTYSATRKAEGRRQKAEGRRQKAEFDKVLAIQLVLTLIRTAIEGMGNPYLVPSYTSTKLAFR